MKRNIVLYLATLVVMVVLDLVFLGTIASGFFQAQVGDMLGELKLAPAVIFYLLYPVGIVIFVNGGPAATAGQVSRLGALFGLFCYATFDLTALALLRHWTWAAAVVDISWGAVVTAVSATLGLAIANRIARG